MRGAASGKPLGAGLTSEADDELDWLLQGVAKTPEVHALRRSLQPGSRLLDDRFVIERALGRGGMGSVFAAHDRVRNERVALKTLGMLTPESIRRMKQEFRTAEAISHANVVALHGLYADGPEWFLTMELVEGVTLRAFTRERAPLSTALVSSVFRQLALALLELHRADAVHGDLTPNNVLIDPRDQRVVLLDFGISRSLRAGRQLAVKAGTAGYMSPEQTRGENLTEASDWYSFGVVLGEVLQEVREPHADLSALAEALRQPEPQRRASADQVFDCMGPRASRASRPSRPVADTPEIFGRDRELELLAQMLHSNRERVRTVWIRGPSGIGKTFLVHEFLRRARAQGAICLSGRCRERESVGHKAVDVLIDDVIDQLEQMALPDATRVLPREIVDLCQLFPALRSCRAVAQVTRAKPNTPDPHLAHERAVKAWCELVRNLRDLGPLVLWVDDLQWGDRESADLLLPLLEGAVPLLFVASYRSIDQSPGPTLEALEARRHAAASLELELAPLTLSHAAQLARQHLGKHDPESERLVQSIAYEAQGHPLFVSELASSVVLTDAPHNPMPVSLHALISERIWNLSEATREVFFNAAVAGAPITRRVLRRSQDLEPGTLERALDVLRARRLVRTTGPHDDHACDVAHDRIREIVMQQLSAPARKELHRRLAHALEREAERNPEQIANHLQAAGELAEAGLYWLEAGERALRGLSFARAAQLFELGLAQVTLEAAPRVELSIRRCEALAFAGEGVRAAFAYLDVAEQCDEERALEVKRRAAEQFLLSGHLAQGLAVIRDVLRALGMRDTRSGNRALLSIALGRARVRLRGLAYERRDEERLTPLERARIEASWTIACSLGVIDFLRGADFQNEHLLMALRAGEPRRLARALTLEVSYGAAQGVGSEARTERLLQLTEQLSRETVDAAAAGLAQLSRGIACYLQGRLSESKENCERALGMLQADSTGAVWEIVTGQRFLVAALFYLGQFRTLRQLVPPLVSSADKHGNLYASVGLRTMHGTMAWLIDDDLEGAALQQQRARSDWQTEGVQLPHCWMLVGETNLRIYRGDALEAWTHLTSWWPRLVGAKILYLGVLRVHLFHLRSVAAIAAAAECRATGGHVQARKLLADARDATERLRKEPMQMAKPLAALSQAAIEYAEGLPERAIASLQEATAAFEQQNMAMFALSARIRLAQLEHGTAHRAAGLWNQFGLEGVKDPQRMLRLLAPGFG